MFKIILDKLAKKCDECGMPGVKMNIPISSQSRELYEKNKHSRIDGAMFLCGACFSKEVKRRKAEFEENEQKKNQNKQLEYITTLRSIVEVTELEAKANELGIDVKEIKTKLGIVEWEEFV